MSGTTAARLLGVRRMPTATVEVTVAEASPVVLPPWARLVVTSWRDEEARRPRSDGLIVASPLRMLFRLASVFNQLRFERAAEDAWHLGLLDPAAAAVYLRSIRGRGRAGVARFETWLERALAQPGPSESSLEHLAVDLCERAGLPQPQRQYRLTLRDGRVIRFDLAWPEIRLAVEPGHSWWHGGDLGTRADQGRDRACAELGWLVVRLDEHVRDDQAAVSEQLRRIYRMRSEVVKRPDVAF